MKKDKLLSELEKIKARGQKTPLEFMMDIVNHSGATAGLRLEAAKAAAPYIHEKMPMAIVNSGEVTVIPPFVPSRSQLAVDFQDELEDF
jgi:hypothetical protein